MKKSILVLTPGDPDGIGPEITWKAIQALHRSSDSKNFSILCIGAKLPFERLNAPVHLLKSEENLLESSERLRSKHSDHAKIWLLPAPTQAPHSQLLEGYQSGWAIEKATQLVIQGQADALVTGPISKERLQKGGYPYPGHTEFLAKLCGTSEVTMMLANEHLRVSLVTTHLALKDVSAVLSHEMIRRAVLQTVSSLKKFWKIPRPKVALTGLNPHCGESGLFGREEINLIYPLVQTLQSELKEIAEISGPFPADTYFARQINSPQSERQNAVVCMYHDQGLIPVKLLDFHRTVNVTLGLPIIRTSVDHGVGFDIVGKGIANPSSLQAAIELAVQLARKPNPLAREQVKL
jgi:4-hydroxythreonine-4-phosphate dehydrogenase